MGSFRSKVFCRKTSFLITFLHSEWNQYCIYSTPPIIFQNLTIVNMLEQFWEPAFLICHFNNIWPTTFCPSGEKKILKPYFTSWENINSYSKRGFSYYLNCTRSFRKKVFSIKKKPIFKVFWLKWLKWNFWALFTHRQDTPIIFQEDQQK